MARHTDLARARDLVKLFEGLLREQTHRIRLADLPLARRRMAGAYRILALDEGLPLPDAMRGFFLELAMGRQPG